MSKILAVAIAGLFAAGAYAQNPAGTSSEQQPVMNSKSQNRAEAKVDARPQGMVKKPVGDSANNTEINPMATGKSANAAQAKQNSKQHGMVKKPVGDDANSGELNPMATGKSANAAQAKVDARNAKAMAKKDAASN
jgi:hypothetical protein